MTKRTTSVLLVILLCGLLVTSTALSSNAEGYDLSWWTVDGGGGVLGTEGGYALNGTASQPDPGLLEGSGYTLGGGFWGCGAPASGISRTYLPLMLSRSP